MGNEEGNTLTNNTMVILPKSTARTGPGLGRASRGQDPAKPQPAPGGLGGTGWYHLIQQHGEEVPLRELVPMNTNNNTVEEEEEEAPEGCGQGQ